MTLKLRVSHYVLYDVDGNTVNGQIASFFPNAWNRIRFSGDPNNFIASTSWYTPTGTANDWVVIPAVNFTANTVLTFKGRAGSGRGANGYEVLVSTTDSAVSSFTNTVLSVSSESNNWNSRTVDLSVYANQRAFIAFRNNTNDGYIIAIDDIAVVDVNALDVAVDEVLVSDKVEQSTNTPVKAVIRNNGLALNSVALNWSVNNGPVNTETITGLSLNYGDTAHITHSTALSASSAGSYSDLKVWVSNPNGQADTDNSNDSLNKNVFVVLGNGTQRKVLFEEFTTAWCQFCPDGHVVMANILAQNSNVIPVSLHSCFGTDAMSNMYDSSLCATLGNGSAPTGIVDRIQHEGDAEPAHSRSLWQARVNARSAVQTSADISMTGSYNDSTRSAVIDVDVDFIDYELPGDIRLSLMIIEDSLSGTGQGWDQVNFYNNQAGHPAFGRGNPIRGYQHRHVLRDILPSTWGDNTTIPNNVVPNNTYSKTFTFNLNNSYKPNDVSFVAVVSYFGTNTDEFEVINAKEIKLDDIRATSIAELSGANASFDVYPNPASQITTMDLTLVKNLPLDITVFDITGKAVINKNYGEMVKGNHKMPIDVSALPNGFYIMKVQVGEEVLSKKISVNR